MFGASQTIVAFTGVTVVTVLRWTIFFWVEVYYELDLQFQKHTDGK
jgi:hypothetical protein